MERLPWMALGLIVLGLTPATASAATIELASTATGKELRYVAGPGEFNNLYVSLWQGNITIQDGYNYGVIPLDAKSPCVVDPYIVATTPKSSCPATDVTSVYIDLGDQADTITYGGMGTFPYPVTLKMGDGNDSVFSRDRFPDKIDCGAGIDGLTSDSFDKAVGCEEVNATYGSTTGNGVRADGKPIGISINGGATFTNSPEVHVVARGPDGTTGLMLDNDGGFFAPGRFDLKPSETYPWRLKETGAERLPETVYARFLGDGLDATETFTDDIILDETPPVVTSASVREDMLRIGARDSVSGVGAMQWRFAGHRKASSFRPFATKLRVHGRVPRYVRVRDRASNLSRWRAISR
jgi:hypothetical protein